MEEAQPKGEFAVPAPKFKPPPPKFQGTSESLLISGPCASWPEQKTTKCNLPGLCGRNLKAVTLYACQHMRYCMIVWPLRLGFRPITPSQAVSLSLHALATRAAPPHPVQAPQSDQQPQPPEQKQQQEQQPQPHVASLGSSAAAAAAAAARAATTGGIAPGQRDRVIAQVTSAMVRTCHSLAIIFALMSRMCVTASTLDA